IPIFAHSGKSCRFTGQGRLMERPQTVYEGLFATFEREEGQLKVQGNLTGGYYRLRGDISSQFVTGLLFVLPLAERDSCLEIIEPFESRSYVILTIETLKRAGIEIEMKDNVIFIPGRQKYQPFDYRVDGDDSQAAFFICYSLMSRQPLTVEGISHDSHQGDHVILELAERFGGELRETENGYAVIPNELKAIEADLADCPDLGPILFACAGLAEGTSHFANISRLRIKESDRLAAMQKELAKLGIEMCYDENDAWVKGVKTIREGITVNSHDDHRIAMALSVLAGCSEQGVIIEGCEAVAKSYPGFYEDINRGLMEVDCL
ncbi:MAG: 3-phosphoshikimate 1-carboxyvinyltransferase, partial [Erysipelotrichaceae bacterium]|nr:3-phosphoshikimate 1-carboxyvinyltransferase [Erysipelotrichaceae bacterium]